MTKNQLEALVRATMDRVMRGEQIEDDFIELKVEWDQADPRRNARQIAGLANAAGGQNVVWIVGADDKKAAIKTPPPIEPADWFPKLNKFFDQVFPTTVNYLSVTLDSGETVIATEFETDQAPYVVKVEGGGQVGREVPFRKHGRIESATHGDLLRILVPKQKSPDITAVHCNFTATPNKPDGYMRGASIYLYLLIDTGSVDGYFILAPQMVECCIQVGEALFRNWSEVSLFGSTTPKPSSVSAGILSLMEPGAATFKFLNDEIVPCTDPQNGRTLDATLRLVLHLKQGRKQIDLTLKPVRSEFEDNIHWQYSYSPPRNEMS